MPTFTIGIPTFNRAGWVVDAIRFALNQTQPDVEVIVCDNASTDDTQAVVQAFGDRVRYIRNESNMGPTLNFCRLVELAQGEYFSWLQDDDAICPDFALRASQAFATDEVVKTYICYSAVTKDIENLSEAVLRGPPVRLNWWKPAPRIVPGGVVLGLSTLTSVGIPPAVAFRTADLRESLVRWDHSSPLFVVERTMLSDVSIKGLVALDPYVGGVSRSHPAQEFRLIEGSDPTASVRQLLTTLGNLQTMYERTDKSWVDSCRTVVEECEIRLLRRWWSDAMRMEFSGGLLTTMIELLDESLRQRDAKWLIRQSPTVRQGIEKSKALVRDLTPPIVWRGLGQALRTARRAG